MTEAVLAFRIREMNNSKHYVGDVDCQDYKNYSKSIRYLLILIMCLVTRKYSLRARRLVNGDYLPPSPFDMQKQR